jgi:hypothetical protein
LDSERVAPACFQILEGVLTFLIADEGQVRPLPPHLTLTEALDRIGGNFLSCVATDVDEALDGALEFLGDVAGGGVESSWELVLAASKFVYFYLAENDDERKQIRGWKILRELLAMDGGGWIFHRVCVHARRSDDALMPLALPFIVNFSSESSNEHRDTPPS